MFRDADPRPNSSCAGSHLARRTAVLSAIILSCAAAGRSLAQVAVSPDLPRPGQVVTTNIPPLDPRQFNPDPGGRPTATNRLLPAVTLRTNRVTSAGQAPRAPAVFNPDPGAMLKPASTNTGFFTNEIALPPLYQGNAIAPPLALPRTNVYRSDLDLLETPAPAPYGSEPLPGHLALPREDTRANEYIRRKWENPNYPLGSPEPPNTLPATNRWRIGFVPWRRYISGDAETPYETGAPMLWHPYKQSILKGDAPVAGDDIFLNLTVKSETEFEARSLPTPSGVSTAVPASSEFFGRSDQQFLENYLSFSVDVFEGYTAFQPVHWAVRLEPVVNLNYTSTRERGVINPNPARGRDRTDYHVTLQQGFLELHLRDLSDNYDFVAARFGNQAFKSDFRGFIFNDINTGARLFGNYDNNRWQYNLAIFDLSEKDSNSGLNTFERRDQRVLVANAYRQDFLWPGYTAQWSFHANFDEGGTHYDENGNLARPAPLGTVVPHDVNAYYLGWAGDGHIGRLNVTHALYQVYGRDSYNGLAGRAVDIDAQMAALELSYDRDWVRYKASVLYASGDRNPTDGKAGGFETITDNPVFTGGPFSWYVHQGVNLAGTSVNLKQRDSLIPDLRTSKTEGQANFVNPGVLMAGLGTEIDVTPKLRNFINLNYIRFMETEPLKSALMTDKVSHGFGWDLSTGFQYRPLLTDNIIISTGFGVLLPANGFRDIYAPLQNSVAGYTRSVSRRVDDFYYNGVLAVTLTY